MHGPAKSPHDCRGFTLLELMLVLAVLVIVASIALPSVAGLLDGQKVDRGADLVRATLGQARVTAIRSGRIQVFVCQAGGAGMAVVPLATAGASRNGAGLLGDENQANRFSEFDFSDSLLPRGVRFTSAAVIDDSRSQAATADAGGGAQGQMQFVLFYPDGTSQDAQLTIANQRGMMKRIVVRGLTGTSRITPVEQQR